ncbi:hypothetical protein BOW53_11205 [Solemya pervernicosa gill symbiont]|nr:hypothetical protein [Solemya pervernicosa gill symbiont]OOZ39474.1 hypothetical protein BOW53_11205 [Solemya pervernicosa gill symbiont]
MAYIALTGIYLYLDTATLFNWKAFGLAISALTLIVVLWAGFWALIGRLFRHQAHFKGQLLATLLAFGLSSLIEPLSDYFDYFSSSTLVGTISEHLVSLLYLTLLLKLNLLLATNVKRTTQAAFVGALSIVLLSYLYTSAEQPEFSTQPSYSATIKPPYAKLGRDIEMESHLDALSSMIDTIE